MNQVATADPPSTIDPSGDDRHRLEGPALPSSEACCLALAAYERAFRMCSIVEPDVGFAERFAVGLRSLQARCRADAWDLSPDRVAALSRLLDEVDGVGPEDAGDWIDRFPRAFLRILERREGAALLTDPAGRRFGERMRMPEPLGAGRTTSSGG